jgi:hypothetical protein
MLQLSSITDAIKSIDSAHKVTVEAYTLGGAVLRALEDAARHGTRVDVTLERHPFGGKRGLARENAHVVQSLRAAGARARLADPIHAKTIWADDTLYLDEKNWRCGDIVLRDDDRAEAASIPMDKPGALEQEAQVLGRARATDGVVVESETFGTGNVTYDALKSLALAGAQPRLLVCDRELRGSSRERSALAGLARAGVRIRVCKDSAKLAAAGDRAWLGSANATYVDRNFTMSDWGVSTGDRTIVTTVRARLEAEWKAAKEFKCDDTREASTGQTHRTRSGR